MAEITLSIDGQDVSAELYDCETARALIESLPLTVTMSRWGEEYYGSIAALNVDLAADARDVMEIGDLAYWLPGTSICIFFGPTPASHGDEPRAASNVNPLGKINGDTSFLHALGPTVSVAIRN